MRLFTGIAIDEAVTEKLGAAIEALRQAANLRWSPPENLHITTKFIEEWPEDRLGELKGALEAVDPPGDFEINISRFGFFPNARQPRMLYAGVESGPSLADLARRIEDAVEGLGCPREERAYMPHVTLARLPRARMDALHETIASMRNPNFGSFQANEFHLYESRPGPRGSVYTKLATWPMTRGTRA